MVFEDYIPQISFIITAVMGVFIAGIIFQGAKSGRGGWTKFGSHLFATKREGFVGFLISIVIGSAVAGYFQPTIENFLRSDSNNIFIYLGIFVLITWFYYNQTYYR